jgi:biotin-(acetyl-CoA carboxylase) ligase
MSVMPKKTKKEFTGIFLGISNNGELILRLDNGRIKKFEVEHTIMKNHKVQL